MSRTGEFVANLSGEMAYKSFKPNPLPPNPPLDINDEIIENLINANKALAVLDGVSQRIPNTELFVSMYVRKEALLSSQIEGTQCTLDDVLNPLNTDNANRDVADVINYIKATEYATKRLNELPICSRLIKEIHAVLIENVRGQEKNPGEYRISQNWIGGAGSTLKTARYIPPNVDDMETAIAELEEFINNSSGIDPLICVALIHYQFETIHPFLDGNGRVGRLLIVLYLMEKKILSTPALYISYFLKRNRVEYYDRMTEVRRTGNYEQWVNFFLTALYESATDAVNAIDKLTALHNENIDKLQKEGKNSSSVNRLFEYVEANPIIEIGKTAQAIGLAYNTVAKSVKNLEDIGVLVLSEKVGRTRIYSYESYLKILRMDTI